MKTLTVDELIYALNDAGRELGKRGRKPADFSVQYKNRLDSSIKTAFMSYYKGLIQKSAMLYYLLLKNHSFADGNKRAAVIALILLLKKNKKNFRAKPEDVFEFTVWIAASPARLKGCAVKAVEEFIRSNI